MRRLLILIWSAIGLFSYYRKRLKSPIVLFWHGVTDNPSKEVEGESFPVELFKKQMRYLKRHYEIISIDEYYKRYNNHSFTNREVVITFDDGYKNNLLVVAPILNEMNVPFTVFVSANNVELQKRFYVLVPRLVIVGGQMTDISIPMLSYHKVCTCRRERILCAHEIEYKIKYLSHSDAEKVADYLISVVGEEKYQSLCNKYRNGMLLTWSDIITLQCEYDCTIGSHCMDHCICHKTQDQQIVQEQIRDSKKLIEARTGKECNYFAYPNGDYTEFSNSIVENLYRMGFSTERKPAYKNESIASVGRIGVPSSYLLFKYAITMGANQFR